MKKYFLSLIAMFIVAVLWAQSDDDVYFVPKKAVKTSIAKETYYIGSDRDVDEYNRHGYLTSAVEALEGDDVIDFEAVEGVYPDSLDNGVIADDYCYDEAYEDDDFRYSRELDRWYGYWSPYCCGWYSPWYNHWYADYWGWYDPWYWSYWGGWYSPWYYPFYWGSWHGHGGIHHGWLASGTHGWGFSNRKVEGVGSNDVVSSNIGKRSSGNVYNNIARRNITSENNSRKVMSSTRTAGNYPSTQSQASTRSYTPSSSSTRGSASSFNSASRSGISVGGMRGGGFSGGGSRGGRR